MRTRPHNVQPAASYADDRQRFARAVFAGLSRPDKHLPTAYLYDERGSALFDAICQLPEYYPTRTEVAIMREHARTMVQTFAANAVLIEYGSGSSLKTRLLLDAMRPRAYVPVDISGAHLDAAAATLRAEYPALRVMPVCADFTRPFDVPRLGPANVVYFPGSTLGNFERDAAVALLRQMATLAGPEGHVVVGTDMRKPSAIVERAYADAAGVTAAFNRNLLVRINRELDADFAPERFEHRAPFDADRGSIVMQLISRCQQRVLIAGRRFMFSTGEIVVTEYSHKYTPGEVASLAAAAALELEQSWYDSAGWFGIQLLRPRA